jgi:hypothetical protein
VSEQPDLDRLILETRRYEFSDGLRDLQLALLLSLGGLAAWLAFEPAWMAFIMRTAARYGRWAAWVGMVPVLLAPLAALAMLRLMAGARRRWLWRHTGMVSPSRWAVPRKVNVLAAAILLGGLALGLGLLKLGLVDSSFLLRMLWAATGWSFGFTLVAMGRNLNLPRYRWIGLAGGVLSTGLLVLPMAFAQAALVFGLGWAGLLAGSGLVSLRRAALSLQSEGGG